MDRLQRIKFLVDQSKLYAQFLASSIEEKPKESNGSKEPEKTEQPKEPKEPQGTKETKGEASARKAKASDPVKKRRKDQPDITTFFKPPPKSNDQPKALTVQLHDYQKAALKWLIMLYQNGLNGILADEMGLGKTLEVIAFLAFLLENGVDGPFLVLAPLSALGNWINELEHFAPSITYTKYYGTPQQRTQLRRKKKDWGNIVVSSYEIVMVDQRYLHGIAWKYIIVDEGHRLKNVDSKLMKVLKSFTSANRMLLTGTPLQNNLTELWALLNFLLPDVFTDLSIFHSWFESGEVSVSSSDEEGLVTSLHDILRPFLLRRLKKDVGLHLPSKREYVVFTGLTPVQQKLYQHILDGTAREYVVEQILHDKESEVTDALVKQARQELRTKSFSNLVMQLRLCCDSPYLFWYPETPQFEATSGKLQMLHELMQRLAKDNHKLLVFTQFARMLDVLEDWATERGYNYRRLDGTTPQADRQAMIDELASPDSDIDMFMVTTRSGGQGVNLVGADTVVLFDSDWNPQQDLQAMDRVHRIGQTRPVLVIRLCMGDTVEQDLLERAAEKLELNNLVIESGHFKGPVALTRETNEQKIAGLGEQLQRHKQRFTAPKQMSDAEFDAMLDRSPAAYRRAAEDPNLGESVFCVKSEP